MWSMASSCWAIKTDIYRTDENMSEPANVCIKHYTHVVKQLRELLQSTLNLLNVLVPILNFTVHHTRLPIACRR